MKIDTTINHGNLSQEFKRHLEFIEVMNVRTTVVVVLLVLYDLPLLAALLSILNIEFLWILIPAIAILHLWGIRLLIINPYSSQFETIRFIGVLGILGSLSCLILVQGMSYFVLNISSIIYYIVINLSILVFSYILIRYQVNKYSADPTKEQKTSNQSKYLGLLAVAPAIGYILGQSTQDTNILKFVIALTLIYLLTLFYVYIAAKFIHKYFFMKANMELVEFQKPSKKESKKGVVIR